MCSSNCPVDLVCSADPPTVTTAAVGTHTSTTATLGGEITATGGENATRRGVCWNTAEGPTVNDFRQEETSGDFGTGTFSYDIATNLTSGTTYYVKAYAENSADISYGDQVSFTTAASASPPSVTTTAVSTYTGTTATLGGEITATGGENATRRGVCWNTAGGPTVNDFKQEETGGDFGTGTFSYDIATNLEIGTTYYVKAYAENSAGMTYGTETSFTTLNVPTLNVTTVGIDPGADNNMAWGTVTDDGGASITEKGVCWGTSDNPTIAGQHAADDAAGAGITVQITDLDAGTMYYVRAYATNSAGTGYGASASFTTDGENSPTVTTSDVTAFGSTTATLGGEVTNTGNADVTVRGVCWNISGSPTTSDSKEEASGTFGTGTFSFNVTGLSSNTTYYVKAYATNSQGTSYGGQVSFATSDGRPQMTTAEATNISTTTATLGGNVTSVGIENATVRGVCWNTSGSPTTSHSTDEETGDFGTGTFTRPITGLTLGTTYHVKAYATNSVGTAYGDEVTFTTETVTLMTDVTSVTVNEGSTATFNVKLSGDPGSNVTVSASRQSGDTDVTVQSASLTFTTSDWDTYQEVTLAAADDVDTSNGEAVIQLTATGLDPASVTATETDDDTLDIVVPDPATVTVPEGGTATFDVSLSAQPGTSVDVTVAVLSGDTDITVQSGASLTFSTTNWNTAQTVTLAAVEDADNTSGQTTIQLSSTSVSNTAAVTAKEQDDDIIVVSSAAVTVIEDATATFTVKLSEEPAGTVTVAVAHSQGDTDITVQSGASLTFTTTDYGTAQTVTLAAATDDDITDGTATIQVSATDLDPMDVVATEDDTDILALEASPASVTAIEGSTATLEVSLSAQPESDVTVTASLVGGGDADITLPDGTPDDVSLTFTSSDWNTTKAVTIAAAEDEDEANGEATIRLVAAGGLTETKDVAVTESDNDLLNLVIEPLEMTVGEGETASFTVALSMQPASDVTVAVAKFSGDADITVQLGESLTFTTSNWDTAQTVTLEATDDDDAANGETTIRVTATGGLEKSQDITATEDDNDTLALVTDLGPVVVVEGSTVGFHVSLSAQPESDITVTVSLAGGGDADITLQDGTPDDVSLTFTTLNWNMAQLVTLAAAEDDTDTEDGTATVQLVDTGGLIGTEELAVVEDDNDTLALVIEDITSPIIVAEGGTAEFNVKLSMQPLDTVAVSVAQVGGDADITVKSGGSLSFTTSTWDTYQKVTLEAAEDDDGADGTVSIQLTAAGFSLVYLSAKEQDNDILAIVTDTESVTVPEDGTAEFNVKLSMQPTDTVSVTVEVSGDADITVKSGASLSFTTSNWDTYQTVTLQAAEDNDVAGGTATIRLSSTDVDTDKEITATEQDNTVLGDIDCDGDVDLADLILALQLMAGTESSGSVCNADVDDDGKIGFEEVFYIIGQILG